VSFIVSEPSKHVVLVACTVGAEEQLGHRSRQRLEAASDQGQVVHASGDVAVSILVGDDEVLLRPVHEAHLLHHDTFGHLHILLNYEWDSSPLLSIVLVGLPELRDRLEMRRNRSLYSRLQRRLVIEPTTAEDTAEYLRYRLKLAGTDKEIFTSDAVTVLHEAALGALRDLDRVATTALRIATRRKRKLVERDVVTDAIALDAPSVP